MGYTHGTPRNAEFKTCTSCGKTFPNTSEYFYKNGKDGLSSECKECRSEKTKNRNEQLKLRFPDNKIEYDDEKYCKKCRRLLPNSYRYFPIDRTCISGLRNICRECNPKYGRFLQEDFESSKPWTQEEDLIILNNYKNFTGKELQQKFFPNRTIRAIETRGSNLGVTGKTEEALERSYQYRSEILSDVFTGRTFSEEWKKKISETKKEYFKTHDGWWLGKHRSEEQRKQISERMKGKWAGDKNPRHINPLFGKENGRWKGGINSTYVELRSETKEWQNISMKFCGYRCVITGGEFDNIHHTVSFRDIVDEIFESSGIEIQKQVKDYSVEEFDILKEWLYVLHDFYGYGACINKSVHKLFHDNYGYTQFSPYDFLDFIYRIDCGEFDDWFTENNLSVNINYEYVNYLESILLEMKSA